MFEILMLIALFGVYASVRMILAERKRRKVAQAKWESFERQHPKSKS